MLNQVILTGRIGCTSITTQSFILIQDDDDMVFEIYTNEEIAEEIDKIYYSRKEPIVAIKGHLIPNQEDLLVYTIIAEKIFVLENK